MTRSLAAVLTAALSCVATIGAPRAAEPATVSWTTFLYDAPSPRAQAIDEPPQGTRVTLGACAEGWCEATVGRASGYLREEVLARAGGAAPLARPPAPAGAPSDQCFVADQAGLASPPAPTRFCAN